MEGSIIPTISSPRNPRGRRPVIDVIQEAAKSYHENTAEEIQNPIEKWEADINRHEETKMHNEEWRGLIPDMGQARGRLTQFKQTLYLNWYIKCILGKALDRISMSLVTLA